VPPSHQACHRTRNAEASIHTNIYGVGREPKTAAKNLACSGASTNSLWYKGKFFPGIDFYGTTTGLYQGQALRLREFAKRNNVKLVVLSIGGNDLDLFSILYPCIYNYVVGVVPAVASYCSHDRAVTDKVSDERMTELENKIVTAIDNIETAMSAAGYDTTDWSLLVQTYPIVLPPAARMRVPEYGTAWSQPRKYRCPLFDDDIDWAVDEVLPALNWAIRAAADRVAQIRGNVGVLDVESAFKGHRLCEKGVGPTDLAWNVAGPAKVEWVVALQASTLGLQIGTPKPAEVIHPTAWGSWALRNCLRAAWNSGRVRGGSCEPSLFISVNGWGEPGMVFSMSEFVQPPPPPTTSTTTTTSPVIYLTPTCTVAAPGGGTCTIGSTTSSPLNGATGP
jgi:hypothetical protein